MLKIAAKLNDLDLYQLACVYQQSIEKTDTMLLSAQQDFYDYVVSFLKEENTFYALWYDGGMYYSAVRLEPYKDGYLLSGLETDPRYRKRGYATALMAFLLEFCVNHQMLPIFAHIDNRNTASICVHSKTGFIEYLDYAVFLDGSVNHKSKTYIFTGK